MNLGSESFHNNVHLARLQMHISMMKWEIISHDELLQYFYNNQPNRKQLAKSGFFHWSNNPRHHAVLGVWEQKGHKNNTYDSKSSSAINPPENKHRLDPWPKSYCMVQWSWYLTLLLILMLSSQNAILSYRPEIKIPNNIQVLLKHCFQIYHLVIIWWYVLLKNLCIKRTTGIDFYYLNSC